MDKARYYLKEHGSTEQSERMRGFEKGKREQNCGKEKAVAKERMWSRKGCGPEEGMDKEKGVDKEKEWTRMVWHRKG